MRKAFLQYLGRRGLLKDHQIDEVRRCLRTAPEPMGSIALSYGMLNCDDIDSILDEQRSSHDPFGEIAIRRGLLTRSQVESLLHVQQMRAASEVAETLILSGIAPSAEVIENLGAFLTQPAGLTLCADG